MNELATTQRPLIALSVASFGQVGNEPRRLLERSGVQITENPYGRRLKESEAIELIRDAVGVIAGTEPLTARLLEEASALRVISRVGAGTDSIDLEAAARRGVTVRTTPDAVTDATAELTLAGILALLRHVPEMDAAVRAGGWSRRMGSLLGERTVGIVGLGRVGRRVAALISAFGARLLAHDPIPDEDAASKLGITLVSLDELIETADIVTLHVPGGAGVVLDAARIAAMPQGAYVVNAARGGLIDEQALMEALSSGRIGGAYLDAFAEEPYKGPLAKSTNVVLTPHAGSYAREARQRMELEAVRNLFEALEEGR